MRQTLLLCVVLLTQSCVNHTELAMEAVEAELPSLEKFSTRMLTFKNIEDYPGKVVCGEYTTSSRAAENSYKPFIYTPSDLNLNPTKEDQAVFCTTEAQAGLYHSTGINFTGKFKAELLLVREDFKQLGVALDRYQSDNFMLPTSTQRLDALVMPSVIEPRPKAFREGGYIAKVPLDPWGESYIYSGPVFAGVQGGYKLLTLGADGKTGGKDENADVKWHHVKYLDHIIQTQ